MARPRSNTALLDRDGQVVAGRYKIQQLLGVGAMGSVWIAELTALKQEVVIKFHEEGFVGRDAVTAQKRFFREARTLASVHHRNVTKLFEAGQTEEGEPYLILERLRGRTLAARLREQGILPLDESLRYARQLADGLDAVHRAGILHRDVKPENIFLHEGEKGVVPKLLDFGLARHVSAEVALTKSGKAVGTPGFMAPEQARGKQDLDQRVDIYSLCATLYECLSGELPSLGSSPVDRLIYTATEEPVPLTKYRPDLAGPIADAVMHGLARKKEVRTPDARALAKALEAAQRAHEQAVERGEVEDAGGPERRAEIGRAATASLPSIELDDEDLESLPPSRPKPPPIPKD